MAMLFKIIGAIGLILISIGVIIKKKRREDIYYICGGLCLEAYSISIGDPIFIILQIVFVIAAVYDFFTIRRKRKS